MPKPHRKNVAARANRHYNAQGHIPHVPEDTIFDYLNSLDTSEPFVLVLDRIQDPHNLGACLRSANAAGVHLVIAPKDRASGLTETAQRIACGAAETTPYTQVTNLGRTLDEFREADFTIVGTGDEESTPLYDVNLQGPLVIAMGAEGTGIRAKTAAKCDHLVCIPMRGTVDCLNVSVATGICLFEAVRQRLED